MAEAHGYADTVRKQGNIVTVIGREESSG